MRLHRFIGKYNLTGKKVEITDFEEVNQMRSVLRLKKGDKIVLADGKGQEAEVILESFNENKILGTVNKNYPARTPLAGFRNVHLYLAILKKENFELAVQKAVECGIASITHIITERTIKTGLNMERLQKIIKEASEQCGRSTLPELFDIFDFTEAINSQADEKIIFHTDEETANYQPNKKANSVNIFVGPEGGFTPNEIELAKNSGFTPASLGGLTLRGETAAIIGAYRAMHAI